MLFIVQQQYTAEYKISEIKLFKFLRRYRTAKIVPLQHFDSQLPDSLIFHPRFHSLQTDLTAYAVTKLRKRRNKRGLLIVPGCTLHEGLINFYHLEWEFLQGQQ